MSPRDLRVPDPSKLIVDGAHGGSNTDVFWLPPMALPPNKAPGYGDPFDAGEPVEIWICHFPAPVGSAQIPETSTCVDGPNGNMTKKFSSSDVQVSTQFEDYHVFWNTQKPELNTNWVYRVETRIGSKRLALADVKLITSLRQLFNINTNEYIPLPDDWTLPIRVRIEKGWNCADRTNKQCTSQVVTNTPIGSPTVVITDDKGAAGSFEGNWIPFCGATPTPGCVPQGTKVVVTIEDQTALLNAAPAGSPQTCSLKINGVPKTNMLSADTHCVKFTTDPVFQFASPVKVAVCVHTDDLTQQLIKYDVNEVPRFLENVRFQVNGVDFTALCEETPHIGSRSSSKIVNYALAALSGIGNAVRSLVVPKSAYAIHLGVGGLIRGGDGGGFSYIAPARPLTLSAFGGTSQSALVGSALANPVQVLISTVHRTFDFESGFPNPLNHLPVKCSIDDGSGTFPVIEGPAITQADVFTDVNGIATCPSWILGKEGANTLRVSTPNIDDGIIAIEEFQGEGGIFPQPVALSNNAIFSATGIIANTPSLVSPENLSVFDFFPRTTPLSWTAVPGAVSYEIDRAWCESWQLPDYPTTCSVWTNYPIASAQGTTFSFDFVGAQPGRWRVRAIYPSGSQGPWSAYNYFRYLQ